MTALTRSLLVGAAVMTALDGLAYLALIVPGHAVETNFVIVGLVPGAAAGVKVAEVVLVLAIATILIALGRLGLATIVLALAIVAGLLGAITTVASSLA